jgi:eukaryotic-like serine/threonine-protein kinase
MPGVFNERWESLSKYLDQALDQDEAARAGWLAALAESDPTMAAWLSNALAARNSESFRHFLEGTSPLAAGEFAAASLIGRQVGPYVIDAEIGRGGMGSIWRARRTDGRYEGTVAIKFVHAAWIGNAGEQRFRIEGDLLGRLDHPHIARLIDAGVLDATQPYLVLEHVEGEPIDAYCNRHGLGLEARIRLFLDVLAAVAHAHSHLIVHRDIKPANIFVTRGGAVKLLDFGIAKLLQEGAGSAPLTQSSASALTPQYAAPEQLLGKPVTTVTDVYSLGLVLYVLFTGAHPITAEKSSSAELVRAIVAQDSPRPSGVAALPNIRGRALQGDLDNILGKALKKPPDERYASADAFAEDLRRFLAHEPVQARPDTVAYRVSKFVSRHRAGVLSAFLVAIALIGTTVFALWELSEARVDRDMAVSEGRRVQGHDAMMALLFDDSVRQAPGDAVHRRLDRARDFIERRYRADPDIAASLLLSLRRRYLEIGDAKAALEARKSAEAIARGHVDYYLNAELDCATAQDLAVAGDVAAARTQLQSARANMGRLRVVSADLRMTCAEPAGRLAQMDGDFATAIADDRVVVKSLENDGEYGSDAWVSANYNLAAALGLSADNRGALEATQRISELIKAQGLKDTSLYFSLASLGCAVLRAGGQPERSIELVESAIADARSGGADVDVPYYVEACRDLSRVAAGESGDVEASLLRNAKAADASGIAHIAIFFRIGLVTVAVDRGDLAAAEARFAPLAPIETQMRSAKQSGIEEAQILLVHSRLDIARGRLADASQRLDQLAALMAGHHQSNNNARNVEALRAQVLLASHEPAAAARHAQAALELARGSATDPKSCAWIGEALLWRARAEAALGDESKAAATAREAMPHLANNLDPANWMIAAAREIAATRAIAAE